MRQAIDLPEEVWSALQQAAKASGMTPAGWIAGACPRPPTSTPRSPADEEGAEDLEPPTYVSVPLELAGAVQVVCVAGKEVPPLPYPDPNEDLSKGRVEGLHLLASPNDPANNRDALVVDFRQIYSLPFNYLTRHAKATRKSSPTSVAIS